MADTIDSLMLAIKQAEDQAALEAAKKKEVALGAQAVPQADIPQGPVSPLLAALNSAAPSSMFKSIDLDKTPSAIDPREWAKANAIVQNQPELQALKEKFSQNEQLLQNPAMLGNIQTDLSPLLGWAATMSDKPGGNAALLQAYQGMRPQQPQDLAKTIMGIQQLIEKNRTGLSEEKLKYLKEALSGYKTSQAVQQEGSVNPRSNPSANSVNKDFRTELSKSVAGVPEKMQQIGMISHALDSGDYAQLKGVLAQYARAVSGEKGVLTDPDIARILPPNFKERWMKLESYISDTPTAKFDPAYVLPLKDMVNTLKKVLVETNSARIDGVVGRFSPLPGFEPANLLSAKAAKEQLGKINAPSAEDIKRDEALKTNKIIAEEIQRRKAARGP